MLGHVSAGSGDGLWSWTIVRATTVRALGGARVHNGAIQGRQIGNPGQKGWKVTCEDDSNIAE